MAIAKRWYCDRKGCRNHTAACFVDSINGNKHLSISANNLIQWNIDIQRGKATLEVPTDSLRNEMSSKIGGRSVDKALNKSTASNAPVIHNHVHMFPTPYSASKRHRAPLHGSQFLGEDLESSPSSSQTFQTSRYTLPSSPVRSDSDPDTEIEEYIQWHINKTPRHAHLLNAAKEKLLAEGATLQTLRKMSNNDFKVLDIGMGVGMRLAGDIKVFTSTIKRRE